MNRKQRLALDARKRRHAGLNDFINERGGWLISIPGATVMRFEAEPGSSLPDELKGRGYVVTPVGNTMRVAPHSGVVTTEVYELELPPGALP